MSSLDHWLSDLASTAGAPTLLLWLGTGALAVVLATFAVIALRRSQIGSIGQIGTIGVWRAALLVVGTLLVWTLLDGSTSRDQAATRRALDARAVELTARAIAPSSPLACLDGITNPTVEAACEKALFATPESIAAAVAYADARLALLADGLELAARDPRYEATFERSRRAIEADRFGIVAQVLSSRGCTASECGAFKLLRDKSRVVANLSGRAFDANVVLHAAAWRPDAPALAAAPASIPASAPAQSAAPVVMGAPPVVTSGNAPTGVPVSSKYDFPSAASIPAVSIMDAEPPRPREPAQDANAGQPPAPGAARPAAPPPRRQTAREPAPAASPPMPLSPPAVEPMAGPGGSQNQR